MDGGNEESCHKILFQSRVSAIQTQVLVQTFYGNEALKRPNVFRWYSLFRGGRELVDDEVGRPKSTRTGVNIAAVADLVKNTR